MVPDFGRQWQFTIRLNRMRFDRLAPWALRLKPLLVQSLSVTPVESYGLARDTTSRPQKGGANPFI